MQQQLLEHIYLNYQPQHYFSTYLKTNKTRVDSRSPSEQRPVSMTITPTSVTHDPSGVAVVRTGLTITRAGTTVLANLCVSPEQVVYSPITNSYTKKLIDLKVVVGAPSAGRIAKVGRNWARRIEEMVTEFIDWKPLEAQLVTSPGEKGQMGFVGTLDLRVVSDDGAVEETVLLAVQILLWTCQFPNINDLQSKSPQVRMLNFGIQKFFMPIKYAQICSQVLLDPTLVQQQHSSYQLTLVCDILSKEKQNPIIRMLKVHQNGSLTEQVMDAIQKLYRVGIQKIGFNIFEIRNKCQIQVPTSQRSPVYISITGI